MDTEVPETTELSQDNYVNALWSDLDGEEKKDMIKRMATYAAQIDGILSWGQDMDFETVISR